MVDNQTQPTKSFFKKYWWVFLIAIIIIATATLGILNKIGNKSTSFNSSLPSCPSDLSGLLTTRIMDKGVIKALIPLGNSNPPGHTFPVDHNYFEGDADGIKHNVYAPGNGIVLGANEETGFDANGNIMRQGITVTMGLCKGVEIVIASPGELAPKIKNNIKESEKSCKNSGGKHEGEKAITTCTNKLDYSVKAGDIIAITDGKDFPEVWALDNNKKLSADVDWERYDSNYYPYAFCLFDLYSGTLKEEYYKLFGRYEPARQKDDDGKSIQSGPIFTPRTIKPLCGQTIQNIVGTIQGDWFGLPKGSDSFPGNNIGDLALIHDNLDPTIGKIVVAGNVSTAGVVQFVPFNSGSINREFSQVKADNQLYCYQDDPNVQMGGFKITGKFLIQLLDDHHLKIENQSGSCQTGDAFKNPFTYER